MKQPHWQAAVTGAAETPPVHVSCHEDRDDALGELRRQAYLAAEDYAEQRRTDPQGGPAGYCYASGEQIPWGDAEFEARSKLDWFDGHHFEIEATDPAECLEGGPKLLIVGRDYTVTGCAGGDCEVAPASTKTYTAWNGHRLTARLKRHPRTGAIITDYKGDPEYSSWDASHADDCGCLDREHGDGGADFAAVERWESPDDYE